MHIVSGVFLGHWNKRISRNQLKADERHGCPPPPPLYVYSFLCVCQPHMASVCLCGPTTAGVCIYTNSTRCVSVSVLTPLCVCTHVNSCYALAQSLPPLNSRIPLSVWTEHSSPYLTASILFCGPAPSLLGTSLCSAYL